MAAKKFRKRLVQKVLDSVSATCYTVYNKEISND